MQIMNCTGDGEVDRVLQGLLDLFELDFPGRVLSAYLVGSRAAGQGAATPTSDLDVRIIFREDFRPGELERFLRLRQAARALCHLAIDCPPLSMARLQSEDWLHEVVGLQSMALHLGGEDVRGRLPVPSPAAFARNVTGAALRFLRDLHGIRGILPPVLDFPDPQGEFFGYNQATRRVGEVGDSLKDLVHAIGVMATCRLAFEAGLIVGRKEDWLPAYRQHIHDEWLPFLEQVYGLCRQEWQYQVPQDTAGRSQLRGLCRQALAFENDYLLRYHRFLYGQAVSGDPTRQAFARQRLAELAGTVSSSSQ